MESLDSFYVDTFTEWFYIYKQRVESFYHKNPTFVWADIKAHIYDITGALGHVDAPNAVYDEMFEELFGGIQEQTAVFNAIEKDILAKKKKAETEEQETKTASSIIDKLKNRKQAQDLAKTYEEEEKKQPYAKQEEEKRDAPENSDDTLSDAPPETEDDEDIKLPIQKACYDTFAVPFDRILKQHLKAGDDPTEIKKVYPFLLSFKRKGIKDNEGWRLTIELAVHRLQMELAKELSAALIPAPLPQGPKKMIRFANLATGEEEDVAEEDIIIDVSDDEAPLDFTQASNRVKKDKKDKKKKDKKDKKKKHSSKKSSSSKKTKAEPESPGTPSPKQHPVPQQKQTKKKQKRPLIEEEVVGSPKLFSGGHAKKQQKLTEMQKANEPQSIPPQTVPVFTASNKKRDLKQMEKQEEKEEEQFLKEHNYVLQKKEHLTLDAALDDLLGKHGPTLRGSIKTMNDSLMQSKSVQERQQIAISLLEEGALQQKLAAKKESQRVDAYIESNHRELSLKQSSMALDIGSIKMKLDRLQLSSQLNFLMHMDPSVQTQKQHEYYQKIALEEAEEAEREQKRKEVEEKALREAALIEEQKRKKEEEAALLAQKKKKEEEEERRRQQRARAEEASRKIGEQLKALQEQQQLLAQQQLALLQEGQDSEDQEMVSVPVSPTPSQKEMPPPSPPKKNQKPVKGSPNIIEVTSKVRSQKDLQ